MKLHTFASGALVLAASLLGCESSNRPDRPLAKPVVMSDSPVAAGRYLVMVGGCNDCHTPGFAEKGMAVPEDDWLIGMPIGFRGPWGTTYATNLRRFTSTFSEDLFVQVLRSRNTRPPMPWSALHAMSDPDLRALYRYLRSLPVKGETMPDYVPPNTEPRTPYFIFEPQPPRGPA